MWYGGACSYMFGLILLTTWQHNVLISQGFCAALGCPVPSPFFLQELLLGPYFEPDDHEGNRASYTKVFVSAEVSKRDQDFYEDITTNVEEWWNCPDGTPYPTFDDLCDLLAKRLNKVRVMRYTENSSEYFSSWRRRAL